MLRPLLVREDCWLGPWLPGRDMWEDELRMFAGGSLKGGVGGHVGG